MDSCAACYLMHKECNAECEMRQCFPKEAIDSFALLTENFGDPENVVKMMKNITLDRRPAFISSLEFEAYSKRVDPTNGSLGRNFYKGQKFSLPDHGIRQLVIGARVSVDMRSNLIADIDREVGRLTAENMTLQSEVQKLMEEDKSFEEELQMLRSSRSEQQPGGTSKKKKLQVQGMDGNEDGGTSKKTKLQVQGMNGNEETAKGILDGNEDAA
ncbi:hypothetical protein POM88_005445 [Heracleum sosnowskyi]|uniref:LOB domain-containing protein n=1 Tax=Heracleum sosnowskyi TaxID=360622 RepID=A0AAD8N4B9_9APIA|nr:hypothetical protein POM88_005445 [Heracleum sosnowskyi]